MKNITVAMLTYNRGRTAAKSITSVARDNNVKHIRIFDDASTENDIKLINNCLTLFSNSTLIKNKKNTGYCTNLIKALTYLSNADTEFSFLCESDMLMSDDWGRDVINAFHCSQNSVALSAMLHREQLKQNRSERFRKRCIIGDMDSNGGSNTDIKPFGSCYTEYPDKQTPVKLGVQKLRYVSNSVGTIVFRTEFLKKLIQDINKIKEYPVQEDAWLSWACFSYNDFNPKSLMVLDPGVALTIGEKGLHGHMVINNLRWVGAWWWRYRWSSELMHIYYVIRFRLTYCNVKKLLKKYLF